MPEEDLFIFIADLILNHASVRRRPVLFPLGRFLPKTLRFLAYPSSSEGREACDFDWENAAVRGSSADFQSAVSQDCILRSSSSIECAGILRRAADYKSAIQQINNLRYADAGARPHSEMRPARAGFPLTAGAPYGTTAP